MRKLIGLFALLTFVGLQVCFAQLREITGTVTDKSDKSPLPGVSIRFKSDPTQGTATDMDGKYSLKVKDGEVLVISFIGMKTQEITVKGQTVLNIELEPSSEMMEEVVISGMYGTARKVGSMTGAVGTVKQEKLKDRPVANIADALQGQVAGLQTFVSSGEPSATFTMRLRGVNSINAGSTPLLIVDGAPVTSTAFRAINSNDIENVVLLKDASATAIYGSRAANGVLLITTKRGKVNEKPRVDLRAQYGFSQMTEDKLPMMNSEEYLNFRELVDPTLKDNAYFQEHKAFAEKYNVDTDWRDYLFKEHSPVYQIDASVTGATEKTNYYLSAGYLKQDGITHHSNLGRMTLRSNISTRVNNYLQVGINIGLSHEKYKTTFSTSNNWYNPVNYARWSDPSYSPYTYEIDENGEIHWGDRWTYSAELGRFNASYVMEMQPTEQKTTRIMGNTFIEIAPLKGLTIKAAQAMDAYDYLYHYKQYPDKEFNNLSGTVREQYRRYYQFTFTNTVEYKFDIKEVHDFTLLAGQESIMSKYMMNQASSIGHTDRRLMLLSASKTPAATPFSSEITDEVVNSYFLRFNYDYDNKYFLDASVRWDGSSLFGENSRWGTFYSLGAMWNMKRENFLSTTDWLDDLRLKVSYGSTGNSSIDPYMWIGSLGSGTYNGSSAWVLNTVTNKDLTWETVESLNAGISARMFNALNIDFDFYRKKTSDMLMNVPYSYTTGHASGWGNVGEMTNTGVDITIGYDILKKNDFFWNISANFNYNKNEITKLYEGIDEFEQAGTGLKYQEGHAYGEYYFVEYAGVNPANGEQLWYTPEGNITNQYSDDLKQFTGKQRFAPYSGGISTQLGWRGIMVSADFAWVLGKYSLNNDRYFVENSANASKQNMSKDMLRMWTTPGQITDIPRAGERPQFDTRFLENASFGRLKNLTLSYTFPKNLLKKTGFIEGARIYGIGRNLWTLTDYSGYDPEVDSNLTLANYPNTKQYQLGVELTF